MSIVTSTVSITPPPPRRLRRSSALLMCIFLSIAVSLSTPWRAVGASATRASGLPFDSGAFTGQSSARAAALAADRGAPLDVVSVFASDSSVSEEAKGWWVESAPSGFSGTLAIGVPLWPLDSSVDAAARGDLDPMYRQIATELRDAGFSNSYVRLSWEMNIPSTYDSATVANQTQWVAAFRRAATQFKSVSSDFRIVFNPNLGDGQTGIEAEDVWPGDDYVDVVGVDAYDWWPAYNSDANWQLHFAGSHGLNFWMTYARAHGKKFALPEWAVVDADPQAGGDDPRYVDYMYTYLRDNAGEVAYESYYDEPASFCRCSLSQNTNTKGNYAYWISRLR